MKRVIGLSALGILLLALVFGCTFGMTLEERVAQFASDLDKATQDQLNRGERLIEVLKQPQFQPMPVEQQIMIIYAANNGYLDDLPLARARQFEVEFHRFMSDKYPDAGRQIAKTGVLNESAENTLKAAIQEFRKGFKEEAGA